MTLASRTQLHTQETQLMTTKRYPLRRKFCNHCGAMYYSRSHRSRWCSGVCQTRNYRANLKQTPAELEQEFIAQEVRQTPSLEAV